MSAVLTTRNAGIFASKTFEREHVLERIPWPKHGYTQATWDPALAEAAAAKYDVALIASEEPQAYTFAKLARIPARAGFYNGWQKPFKSWWARRELTDAIYRPAAQPDRPLHEVQTLFKLGRGLHAEHAPTKRSERLRPLILDREIEPGNARVVQITSKWLSRERTPDVLRAWFAALAARNWTAVCSEAERELALKVTQPGGLPVTYCASVREWKEVLAGAAHVLTPDTGAAHLAGMLGVRCTDLFEAHRYEAQVRQWAPWSTICTVAQFPGEPNHGA
jgi:ADP-heptose:LPS heptosyltransferase